MPLIVDRDANLPPMAWCAKRVNGSGDVRLICGASVEVRGDAFFEGAWDGPFSEMGFDSAADVFGSGGIVDGGELLVVTPSHTCDRVQYLQRDRYTLVSNSLAFLLQAAGEELDPGYAGYATDFTAIVSRGIDGFDTPIPTRSGTPRRISRRPRLP